MLAANDGPARVVPLVWVRRAVEVTTAYLPLLLMALLALGTWWLVKNTPLSDNGRPPAPPRHVADYTMAKFVVQRFTREGAMRAQIEGDLLRHYPDTDRLEIDNPRIRAIGKDGVVMHASAQRAFSNADGSEVQLEGDAHVVREASVSAGVETAALDFRSEFLQAFLDTERVHSHLPVTLTQGATVVRAAGIDYDNLSRVVEFKGPAKAVFPAALGSRKAAR